MEVFWVVIGVIAIFVVVTPLTNALINRIWPLTPEQQEARRLAAEHRRKFSKWR